ncbi:formate/nitrite transporter family protein [Roseibacterium beibuensis]|uniref:Formate/nitrite transporter family protein n=1 Tax=[Roseibacterium] beibuensis TaxID=1193142 RepID=A0ABP9LLF1_9RHOB|nr:formate/nitrite transporter family protein [Roseibacterium beibuensis]MCS6626895.1 formate/nitrite transporter family protein [Roseibacterium beibuensis]
METEQAIREATRLNSKMIYEVVRRDGDEELERPTKSLIWSGLAAGILISFSVLAEAVFRSHLPDTSWRPLVENLGYSFGFLMVILGRMQLFTENTITTILPLVAERSKRCVVLVLRLWGIVLVANVAGAALAGAFFVHAEAFSPELRAAIFDLSAHATGFPPLEAFLRAIPAGVLVAGIVWMMPGQSGNEVWIIVLFTWLIAAGDFTHVIAGAVEVWVMLLDGRLMIGEAIGDVFLPILAGNIFGGTLVFALLAWGQVKAEVEPPPDENSHGAK